MYIANGYGDPQFSLVIHIVRGAERRFRAGGDGAERKAGGTQIVLFSAPATSAR
jgi:hypothetical protein